MASQPRSEPPRGPFCSDDGASRRAREHAVHCDPHHPVSWGRAAHRDATGEERWGSGCDWGLDEVLAGDDTIDDEIDPLPIPPLVPRDDDASHR